MGRRNTIDNLHGNWPLFRYYYTHNNGSCDDILIHHKKAYKNSSISGQISEYQPDYETRRKSFPLDARQYRQQHQNHRNSTRNRLAEPPILKRFPTTTTTIRQQKNRKKRETLANLILNLSRSNSSAVANGNIGSSSTTTTTTTTSKADTDSELQTKWDAIRQYDPHLDNQRILEQDSGSSGSAYQEQRADTVVVDMNESSRNNSLPAGQDNVATSNDVLSNDEIVTTAIPPAALETSVIPMSSHVNRTDMFLFLFGFLFFPLWWAGTWRFFMRSDKGSLHNQQRAFQIVNCCMTLVSILLLGLIIGLTITWA